MTVLSGYRAGLRATWGYMGLHGATWGYMELHGLHQGYMDTHFRENIRSSSKTI